MKLIYKWMNATRIIENLWGQAGYVHEENKRNILICIPKKSFTVSKTLKTTYIVLSKMSNRRDWQSKKTKSKAVTLLEGAVPLHN